MISAFIFSGPTLPAYMVGERIGLSLNEKMEMTLGSGEKIKFLPPVAEGDILRALDFRPKVLGIIDGYFENTPSVWHREILHALSMGVHVLGSSSMGALRAAELEAFGMEGVGAIFQSLADGFLEDDDEVTVVHGPEELGFLPLSEAMVNIRATLASAQEQGILDRTECDTLIAVAKSINYKERTYGKVLSTFKNQGRANTKTLERLEAWLQNGRRDQKLSDAMELVETVIRKLSGDLAPKSILFHFEKTVIWEEARTKDNRKAA